jgi:hypothetical protein
MYRRTEDLLKLRELPEVAPPPAVWERVLAARDERLAARRFWYGAAAAAVVGVAGGVAAFIALEGLQPAPVVLRGPGAVVTLVPSDKAPYAPLVEESARLERLLAELPAPPRLMAGATAGTVAGLEDRIAFVDAQLSYAAARDLEPSYREALWGERVELMNALVYVRFAQMQGF